MNTAATHVNTAPSDDDGSEEAFDELLAEAGLARSKPKNWPHMKFLCTNPKFKDVIGTILRAVDEFKCTSELAATIANNPKGNRWNHLYDNCFGGGTQGRGILAGHLPQLANANKLKQKVMDIWAYLKKEGAQEYVIVDKEHVKMAHRQEKEYNQTKANDKASANKQKQHDEQLRVAMQDYEAGLGAMPPGAKGIVGAGRRQHSTNLKTNQPAAYSYANLTAIGAKDAVVIEDKTPPKPKLKVKGSSTMIQGNSLAELEKLGKCLEKGISKLLGVDDHDEKVTVGAKRKRAILQKQEVLEKAMAVYQKYPSDESKKKMEENMKKYMKLADELEALIDEEE